MRSIGVLPFLMPEFFQNDFLHFVVAKAILVQPDARLVDRVEWVPSQGRVSFSPPPKMRPGLILGGLLLARRARMNLVPRVDPKGVPLNPSQVVPVSRKETLVAVLKYICNITDILHILYMILYI